MLRDRFEVIVQSDWSGEDADALIALHARRSAGAIERFDRAARPRRIAVILSGTDLYRDWPAGSPEFAASLDRADRIVALQSEAAAQLPERWRGKAQVIYQSAEPLAPLAKPAGRLDAIAVGHLRVEKDPRTIFAAMRALPAAARIRLRHVGDALDAALGLEAANLAKDDKRYVYEGALPHDATRVLVHPSIMEGGANVIVEAVTAGTPVIASRMAGNVGMLGEAYPGYFEPGDASTLARLLVKALEDPAYLEDLRHACEAREPLFRPEAERAAIVTLAESLVGRE
jgi:putative glycosyltransferase (TIGR04348 family)